MVPYSKEGGWNIPAVGRWIGIVIVVSALVGGAYDFLWVVADARTNDSIPDEFADRLFIQGLANVWRSVLYTGALGVMVFLLAELIDRVTWPDDGEDVVSRDVQDSASD